MSRIVHLALKVEDLEHTTKFYREVFGFVEVATQRVRDHTSRHLSDGVLDVALIRYDSGSQSAESQAAGAGPCIHHFGVEVDDLEAAARRLREFGCEFISDPGVIPIKFRAPGGTVCEIVPKGRYKKPATKKATAGKPAASRPRTSKTATRKPASKKPAATRKATRKPAATTPATGRTKKKTVPARKSPTKTRR